MSDLTDKIILITGATSGIGEVTARELARQGGHIIILTRNAGTAAYVRKSIIDETGNQKIDLVFADLSSLQQVRDVAAVIQSKYPRIDILINNAGIMANADRKVSVDGNELTLAANHLGPFLLTRLLFDLVQKSPAARIINVASIGHQFAKPSFDDIQSEHEYSPLREYGNTKLWNIMFTQELTNRLRTHGITNVVANALHPGNVATNFGKQAGTFISAVTTLARPFLISAEEGAQTSIFLASDPQMGSVSGEYFIEKKVEPVKSDFNTPANNRRLWELSEQLTDTTFLD